MLKTRLWTGGYGVRIKVVVRDLLFIKMARPALRITQPPIQSVKLFFPYEKRPGVNLTTLFYTVQMLRTSAATFVVPKYTFMAYAGRILPFYKQ